MLPGRHNGVVLYEKASVTCYSPVSANDISLTTLEVMSINRMRRVLVVDDEPDMAEWLATVVARAGYETRVATRGAEGAIRSGPREADDD